MVHSEIKQRVLEIQETFGMKAAVCAKAMGVTTQVFNLKKHDGTPEHTFNEKNLYNLIAYIKKEAEKLELKTR